MRHQPHNARLSFRNTKSKPPARLRLTIPLSGGQRREEFPQFGFEYLPIVVLGQRVDEAVFARTLEAGDVVEAELVQLLGRNLLTGYDEGDHFLAPFGMRPS